MNFHQSLLNLRQWQPNSNTCPGGCKAAEPSRPRIDYPKNRTWPQTFWEREFLELVTLDSKILVDIQTTVSNLSRRNKKEQHGIEMPKVPSCEAMPGTLSVHFKFQPCSFQLSASIKKVRFQHIPVHVPFGRALNRMRRLKTCLCTKNNAIVLQMVCFPYKLYDHFCMCKTL